jgi:hypothetical protein
VVLVIVIVSNHCRPRPSIITSRLLRLVVRLVVLDLRLACLCVTSGFPCCRSFVPGFDLQVWKEAACGVGLGDPHCHEEKGIAIT